MSRYRGNRMGPEWARTRFRQNVRGIWHPEYRDSAGNVRDLSVAGNDGTPTGIEWGQRALSPQLVGRAARSLASSAGIQIGTNHGIDVNGGIGILTWISPAQEMWGGGYSTLMGVSDNATAGFLRVVIRDDWGFGVYISDPDLGGAVSAIDVHARHRLRPLLAYVWIERGGSGWFGRVAYKASGQDWQRADVSNNRHPDFSDSSLAIIARTGGSNPTLGDWHGTILLDRDLTDRELDEIAHRSGWDRDIPAWNLRHYVSAYPTKTTIETAPEFYISSAGEPDAPAIDAGDESPTNLGKMFGATNIAATQATASTQPIWRGPWLGWEFGGDDWWDLSNFTQSPSVMTWFWVVQRTASADTMRPIAHVDGTGARVLASYPTDGALNMQIDASDGAAVTPSLTFDATKRHVAAMRVEIADGSLSAKIWHHSGISDSAVAATAGDLQSSVRRIGAVHTGAFPFIGTIYDHDQKEAALSDQQVIDKIDELASKWGIS